MKIVITISRILVGILFIISGFIKLNDPIGFSYKLEEYFSEGVLNIVFLEPFALTIALITVILEVILGIMLLLGFKPKLTVWSLLSLIIFFTFLTFYSAYFNKVTDCGCFGDAIKLTPWQSFYKDLILLLFILLLFFNYKKIKPIFSKKWNIILVSLTLLSCVLFANYVINHLPLIDFRAYKVGTNIKDGMIIPEDAPKPVYEYHWKFNLNGEEKIITTLGDYPTIEGDFIDVETTEIQKGYEPPIHDFSIEKNGTDFTEKFLNTGNLTLFIASDIEKTNTKSLKAIKTKTDYMIEKGFQVIGLSASDEESTKAFTKKHNLNFEFYFTDETALKTIIRSNPGFLKLTSGTIIQKIHANDIERLIIK